MIGRHTVVVLALGLLLGWIGHAEARQPGRGPQAPSALTAVVAPEHTVMLTWVDNSSNELGFRIVRERRIQSNKWGESTGFTVGANITSYLDTPGTGSFRYRVRAYNSRGNSSYTPYAYAEVGAVAQPPAAPSGVNVTDRGNGVARVTWEDQSSNETGFDIERQPSFSAARRVGANVVQFDDQTQGGTFAYRVRAVNDAGTSAWTPWVSQSIAAPNSPPSGGEFPIITPGPGWSGPTAQPAPMGDPGQPGYDAKAIARWDVVPYQTFSGDFNVGVIAFHISGIAKVDFSCNGGEWTPVPEMRLNPQTGVWEYTAQLRAGDFPSDGLVEVRAVVWPNVGEPRVLQGAIDGTNAGSMHFRNGNHSLFLSTNANGSLPTRVVWADAANGSDSTGNGSQANPFATPAKALASVTAQYGSSDGATCYLMPGSYTWQGAPYPAQIITSTRWATVTPAPGVDRSQVIFAANATGGFGTKLLRAYSITQNGHGGPRTVSNRDTYFWFDTSVVAGEDRFTGGGIASGSWSGVFVTDSEARNAKSMYRSATFARNCIGANFSDTPLGQDTVVINVRLDGFERHPSGTHADVFHWFYNQPAYRENRIIYGLDVKNFHLQGWQVNPINGGGQQLDNVALVNIHISKDRENVAGSWWKMPCNHLLMVNVQLPDQSHRWKVETTHPDGGRPLRNVAITNCVFRSFSELPLPSGTQVRNLHLLRGQAYGTWVPQGERVTWGERDGGTTVSELFIDPAAGNYIPLPWSVIDQRPAPSHGVPVDALNNRFSPSMVALGAFGASVSGASPGE